MSGLKENILIIAARKNKKLTKKETRQFVDLLTNINRDTVRYVNQSDLNSDSYSVRFFQNLLQVHQARLSQFYNQVKNHG